MKVRQFRYGADNLGYLVYADREAMAVDGGAVEEIMDFLETGDLTLKYVVNTHSHGDHTGGNRELVRRTGAEFLDAHRLLSSGSVDLDGEAIRVIHTPGHTGDSVCFHFDGILLSGDTLFNGKVGRCFTGDTEGFYRAIGELLGLPDDTIVYAGHDYVEEYMDFARRLDPDNRHIDGYLERYDPRHVYATLGEERQVDPFLRLDDDAIVAMLVRKGLPAETELDRWKSLISLM